MKKTLIIATALCALSVAHVHAQWIVYDPSVHTQTILNGVQEIAKFIEVINNQVQQIQSLKNQLDEFKRYESVFGDPSQVLLTTVKPLTDDLKKTEVGRTLAALEGTANAGQAMLYNAGGLFHSIGTEFTTPGGQKVKRREAEYLPVAAVQKTTYNYLSVSTDAAARRAALKNQIAATTEQLRAAKTDAAVQKLTGVLIGLSAALNSADHEVSQATASALVQDVANRADEKRQLEAHKERQHAEFAEAVENYGKTFRLLTEPSRFPAK